ncbi:uncharacterized protein LY79DRAFT_556912 [Colletotrichum navitas]|uniref:Uncharacterized protein n=1 Tax=Colletotrichum navitas TaxID=681940 RepID=A0AAD8PWS8_9PEZI|nr:uncharacterized protein LY79DRAFT_556912 [Colletotrichum navitas]KAK1586114.1 hypothetical protein LY79DRAFT_556912 [Colletotrichum navitas]
MLAGELEYRKVVFDTALENLREAVRRKGALTWRAPPPPLQHFHPALGLRLLE